MTSQQRETIRLSILRYLGEASPFALKAGLLLQQLRAEGNRGLEETALLAELVYLRDKGLIQRPEKIVSPENTSWRITASGTDFLAENQS